MIQGAVQSMVQWVGKWSVCETDDTASRGEFWGPATHSPSIPFPRCRYPPMEGESCIEGSGITVGAGLEACEAG